MGGFITPYANSIGSSVIEQISCLSSVSESFSGKSLAYFCCCVLGLMSDEQIIRDLSSLDCLSRPRDRTTGE